MTGREIGSMFVENDLIQIIETQPGDTVDDRTDFLKLMGPDVEGRYHQGGVIVAEWWATVEDPAGGLGIRRPIAYACLTKAEAESVRLFVIVRPDRRGIGIGKVMLTFATDLAIHYRKREIVAYADSLSVFKIMLENQEFEVSADAAHGQNLPLVKKLNWQ